MANQYANIEINAAHDPEIKGGTFSFSSEPITVGTGQITLDEMPAYYYRGARYMITVTDEQNNVEISEWLLMHDTVSISLTNLSTVNNLTQGYLGTFTGKIVRGHMQLLFDGNSLRHVIRYSKQPIKADLITPQSIADQLVSGTYSQEGTGATGEGTSPMLRLIDDAAPGLGGNLNVNNHSIYGVNVTINPSGRLIVTSDIVPQITATKNIGSATKRWETLYANNLYVGNVNLTYNQTSNRIQASDGASTYNLAKNLQDLYDVDSTSLLNSQALLWNNVSGFWTPSDVTTSAVSKIQLLGSDLIETTNANDTLTIEAGYGITITANPSSKRLTFSTVVVDTNTTYNVGLTTDNTSVNFNLLSSDNVTDSIKFTPGSGISITRSSTKEILIAAVQVADLQSVTTRGSATTRPVSVLNSTLSTSTSTGALIVQGGAGIGGTVNIGTDLYVGSNVYVTGSLTVNGTTTTVNSTTVSVTDKNIELGSTLTPTDVTANGGGITLRGTTDKTISWSSSNASWNISEHINLSLGKAVSVNNQNVLSETTLGATVVNSSLTSLGTLTGLTSSGVVNVSNGTASTAINNGAVVVSGGVGVGGNLFVGGTLNIASGFVISGPINLSNNVTTMGPISEKIFSISGAQFTITHDWSQYTIFYHTNVAGSFTADFINVPTTVNRTISGILVIAQGTTPYIPTGVSINSTPQTVKWQGGSAPIGTTNGTDVVTFSMFKIGASWTVLGQLVSFG